MENSRGVVVVRSMCSFMEGEESWRSRTAKEIIRSRHCRIY
jgi:hypothetical protein